MSCFAEEDQLADQYKQARASCPFLAIRTALPVCKFQGTISCHNSVAGLSCRYLTLTRVVLYAVPITLPNTGSILPPFPNKTCLPPHLNAAKVWTQERLLYAKEDALHMPFLLRYSTAQGLRALSHWSSPAQGLSSPSLRCCIGTIYISVFSPTFVSTSLTIPTPSLLSSTTKTPH